MVVQCRRNEALPPYQQSIALRHIYRQRSRYYAIRRVLPLIRYHQMEPFLPSILQPLRFRLLHLHSGHNMRLPRSH